MELEVIAAVGCALIEVGHMVLCWGLESFGETPDASGLYGIPRLDRPFDQGAEVWCFWCCHFLYFLSDRATKGTPGNGWRPLTLDPHPQLSARMKK